MARQRNLALWGNCPHCGNEFKRKPRFRQGKYNGLVPQTYCSKACANYARGPSKGFIDKNGYRIMSGGKRNKQIPEHHLVMESTIGRPLLKGETVHHKNGKRDDNRPENLELWSSRHGKGQRVSDRICDAKSFLAEQGIIVDTFGYGDIHNSC